MKFKPNEYVNFRREPTALGFLSTGSGPEASARKKPALSIGPKTSPTKWGQKA